MKTRKIIIYLILSAVIGLILQLFLHEMGHVLVAIITGNKIGSLSLGSESFAGINIVNDWSIPIISLGSFLLPLFFYIAISFFKNVFIKMVNMFIGVITAIQLVINLVAIIAVDKESVSYNTYDLGILVSYCDYNPIIVAIITFLISLIFIVIIIYNTLKLMKEL